MRIRNEWGIRTKPSERGVALIATLVFLFIITVIVVVFLNEVEDRIRYRAQTAGNEELRKIAYDYLEYTYGILREFQQFDAPIVSQMQGWGDPLGYEPFPVEYEGLDANVRIEDATNKIPLNKLDESTFVVLLESIGMDAFTAARYRDCYFDWIDADDDPRLQGAESREYELNRRLYLLTPSNQKLQSVSDFHYVMGFKEWLDPNSRDYHPEWFDQLMRMVTVDYDYPVNLNVASGEVLGFFKLLSRMNPEAIQLYLAGKDGIPNTEDDRIIDLSGATVPTQLKMAMGDSQSSPLFDSEAHVVRIVIDLVRYETYAFHLEAVVDLGGSSSGTANESRTQDTTSSSQETSANEENSNTGTTQKSNNSSFEVLVIRENI